MANPSQLSITTQLIDDHWVITATVVPGSYLPAAIFMYENTGTTQLGTYQGVCAESELLRMQVWTGVAIPQFGNRYVRYTEAKIILDTSTSTQTDVSNAILNLTNTTQQLSTALQASASTTTVVNIT